MIAYLGDVFGASRKNEETESASECCSKCGSADQWAYRVPNGVAPTWQCWHCEPPRMAALVGQRRGPLIDAERVREALRLAREASAIVVSMERTVCDLCGCRWLVESASDIGVELRCWCCRTPLDPDVVAEKISEPAAEKNKFATVRKKREAKNATAKNQAVSN